MYGTGRMTLRPFTGTAADAALVLALDSDPEVMRWINGGRPTTPRTVRERTLPGWPAGTPAWVAGPGSGRRTAGRTARSSAGSSCGPSTPAAPPSSNSATG